MLWGRQDGRCKTKRWVWLRSCQTRLVRHSLVRGRGCDCSRHGCDGSRTAETLGVRFGAPPGKGEFGAKPGLVPGLSPLSTYGMSLERTSSTALVYEGKQWYLAGKGRRMSWKPQNMAISIACRKKRRCGKAGIYGFGSVLAWMGASLMACGRSLGQGDSNIT